MDISKRIASLREAKGFTQKQIADIFDMEQSNYSRLEKRGNKLTIEQLEKIGEALGVTVVELLTGESEKAVDVREIEKLQSRINELEDDKEFLQDSLKIKENGLKRYRKIILDMLEENRSLYDIMLKVEPTESNGITPETINEVESWLKTQIAMSEMLEEIFNKK